MWFEYDSGVFFTPHFLPGLEVRAGLTLLNLLTTPRHIQLYKRVVLSGSTVVDYREA
jgi:hypothetical protein